MCINIWSCWEFQLILKFFSQQHGRWWDRPLILLPLHLWGLCKGVDQFNGDLLNLSSSPVAAFKPHFIFGHREGETRGEGVWDRDRDNRCYTFFNNAPQKRSVTWWLQWTVCQEQLKDWYLRAEHIFYLRRLRVYSPLSHCALGEPTNTLGSWVRWK